MPIRKYIAPVLMLILLAGTAAALSREMNFSSSAFNEPLFSTPVSLSDNGNASNIFNATSPNVVSVGDHVYVAWSEYSTGAFFRESPEGGLTWYPPLNQSGLNLARSGGRVSAPLLSANGSNVYVVWSQYIGTQAQVFEATSTNYGAGFSLAVQLSNVPGQPTVGPAITPVIASWGSTVSVAYNANQESYVTVSSNNGTSWTPAFKYGGNGEPQVAIYQNNVYAVADAANSSSTGPIDYTVSNNAGINWSAPQSLTPRGSEAWVAASASNVYITWEAKGANSTVYLSVSNNDGKTFAPTVDLTNPGTISDAWAPMVWAYGNSSWIAVHTYPGGNKSQVYMYTSANGGATWSSPVSLTGPLSGFTDTGFPLTVSSSDGVNVFAAWPQQVSANYWRLMVSYSPDGGTSWTPPPGINVSQNPNGTQASNNNDVANAAIWSSGASVFAVWQYTNNSAPQGSNIMFSSYIAPSNTTTTTSSSSGVSTTTNSSTTSSSGSSVFSTTTSSSVVSSSTSTATHTQSSSTSTASSNSALILDAGIAAAVVVIAAIVAAVLIMRRRR